jgi:hypothetical protein
MLKYYWCFECERAFNIDGEYGGNRVRPGNNGGFWCPFCGASHMETLDWESYTFGPAAANNYPDRPVDGGHYPLYPTS